MFEGFLATKTPTFGFMKT